jgi:glycosyltransferase involved in cell wall biosynthesis
MINILVLSRNYPSTILPLLGSWVKDWAKSTLGACEVRVVAPVPYYPPLPGPYDFRRFRQVPAQEWRDGIQVSHPRFLTGPGYTTHTLDAQTYYWGVSKIVDRLWQETPFDLIHAHFIYPDGVVGARLSQRYGVPFVITEHAFWQPWLDQYPHVRKLAIPAAQASAFHIAVSQSVRQNIAQFTGENERLRVIPVGVDMDVFTPLPVEQQPDSDSILYVGRIHETKGVDVLLHAMRLLVDRRPTVRLSLIGGSFYPQNHSREVRMMHLAEELDLNQHVRFLGIQPPSQVAEAMRRSTLLVLPSRRETLGAVLIEALACGTPVVATRCGGPEDVVIEAVGRLVPKEDPSSLAQAMETVLDQRQRYDPQVLRHYAEQHFSWQSVAEKTVALYQAALS